MKKSIKSVLVFSLFLAISIFFFKQIIFSPGHIIGSDWVTPATKYQIDKSLQGSVSTWSESFFGGRNSTFTTILFHGFLKFLWTIGLGSIYSKIILLLLFTFAGFNMYLLGKFFKLKDFAAFLAGLFYITTPVFFNYSIMGWVFVLFSLCLFPLVTKFFIKAVQEKKLKYVIFCSVIFAVSMFQSQSPAWFMVIFLALSPYLIRDRESFFYYLKSLTIIIILFFLLNLYWLLGLIIVPDARILGSTLVNSTASLGTLGNFTLRNIMRLWGNLYNYQYETFYNKNGFLALSFTLPFLSMFALSVKKNTKLVCSFWLIALTTLFMFLLNIHRDILLRIPFSNVIRDFPRFTVLPAFAYSILSAIFIDFLLQKRSEQRKLEIVVFIIIVVWFLSIFPWWKQEITNWQSNKGYDTRLRTIVYPKEYFSLEEVFAKKKLDQKVLYWPVGIALALFDDIRFHGLCNEVADVFAGYSPIPGSIGITERGNDSIGDYMSLLSNNFDTNLRELLYPTNIRYFVVRKNALREENKFLVKRLKELAAEKKLIKYVDNDKITVYQTLVFLPHLYIPKQIIIARDYQDILKILIEPDYDFRSAILLSNNNKKITLSSKQQATIEFKKINPTKYRVIIHQATDNFPLVFSESFYKGWGLYLKKFKIQNSKFKTDLKFNTQNYQIISNNKEDQASREEVKQFIDKGWTSNLGNENEIHFISKNFQGTIQNNNLLDGNFFETWFLKKVDNHQMVNGYANSWFIEPKKLCKTGECEQNTDGSYDMELIVEFWPQQLFYIGCIISVSTLIISLYYVVKINKKI